MPKLVKSIPTYRKHRGSGQAVVSLNGRDFYLGPWGTKASKLEYDRLIAEWLHQGRQVQPGADNDGLTIVELIAAYLHYASGYYRKNGRSTSEMTGLRYALRYVKSLYGRKQCGEFGPIALQAIRTRMIDDGWSRGTINQQVGRIVRMFRWGVSQQLIPSHLAHALESVPGLRKGRTEAKDHEPVLPVDDKSVEATIPLLPAILADMVRLQRLTGMRPAELCMIRPCDIDRSGEVWIYHPESHKTQHHGRARTVLIGPQAQGVLLRYLARDPETHCFRPCDSEAKRRAAQHAARRTPLSCGNRPGTNRKAKPKRSAGECYDANSYRHAIHRACDKAKIDRWSPNRLRHSAATEIRKRFGLEAAQVVLGHAAADVTQIYAERDIQKGIEVAKMIG